MGAEAAEHNAKLARLRALAEEEMRRRLPDEDGAPPSKRHKGGGSSCAAGRAGSNGGRFDYGASKELAIGVIGFLVTCGLQRENSARKEAIPLLQRYLQQCGSHVGSSSSGGGTITLGAEGAAPAVEESAAAGEAKVAAGEGAEVPAGAAPEVASADAAPGAAAPEAPGGEAAAAGEANLPGLAAIKLSCRGVVALKLAAAPASTPADAVGADGITDAAAAAPGAATAAATSAAHLVREVAAALLADVEAGHQPRLQHCQRVVPVQTTCRVEQEGLQAAGTRLAALVAAAMPAPAPAPAATAAGHPAEGQEGAPASTCASRQVTFGIALKQRALNEGSAAKAPAVEPKPATASADVAEAHPPAAAGAPAAPSGAAAAPPPLLDRGAIIGALAAGFEGALRQHHSLQASVDLKAPDWVLVAEVVPAGGALYAALCALPRSLCVLKPKLHIKPVGKA